MYAYYFYVIFLNFVLVLFIGFTFLILSLFLTQETKTIRMDAKHFNTIEYNAHNLFGITEAKATSKALEKIRNKRAVGIY
jgi:hypothetical protein